MENPVSGAPHFGEALQVPPGSTLDRGMVIEKRIDDHPEEGGTLNSGGPEAAPAPVERRSKAIGDQPTEDVNRSFWESDPPIVVRDGNAGHKAKGWAGSNASKGLTSGHVDPEHRVNLPACNGSWIWHSVLDWFQTRAS
jgi:hypothetical protein